MAKYFLKCRVCGEAFESYEEHAEHVFLKASRGSLGEIQARDSQGGVATTSSPFGVGRFGLHPLFLRV